MSHECEGWCCRKAFDESFAVLFGYAEWVWMKPPPTELVVYADGSMASGRVVRRRILAPKAGGSTPPSPA